MTNPAAKSVAERIVQKMKQGEPVADWDINDLTMSLGEYPPPGLTSEGKLLFIICLLASRG